VEIEVNTFDNDFMIAISSGILSRHLRGFVTAGKSREDISDRNGLRFVTSLLISFWMTSEKWISMIFSDKTQVVFDHSRDIYDRRKTG